METFNEIINYIARTNLFNFVIFLLIILFIGKKFGLSSKVEKMRVDVESTIDESKATKTESETFLREIEESIANLEDEIEVIIKKSEENAHLVGSKIIDDANRAVLTLKDNAGKSLDAKANLLKNDILKRALNASVEVAKGHIINELQNNPDLHYKLIDESVESLSGVDL